MDGMVKARFLLKIEKKRKDMDKYFGMLRERIAVEHFFLKP